MKVNNMDKKISLLRFPRTFLAHANLFVYIYLQYSEHKLNMVVARAMGRADDDARVFYRYHQRYRANKRKILLDIAQPRNSFNSVHITHIYIYNTYVYR